MHYPALPGLISLGHDPPAQLPAITDNVVAFIDATARTTRVSLSLMSRRLNTIQKAPTAPPESLAWIQRTGYPRATPSPAVGKQMIRIPGPHLLNPLIQVGVTRNIPLTSNTRSNGFFGSTASPPPHYTQMHTHACDIIPAHLSSKADDQTRIDRFTPISKIPGSSQRAPQSERASERRFAVAFFIPASPARFPPGHNGPTGRNTSPARN